MSLTRFVLLLVLISGFFCGELLAISVTVNGTNDGNVAISSSNRTLRLDVDDSGGDQVDVTVNFPGVSNTWSVEEDSSCRGAGSGITDTNPQCNNISFTTTWNIPNSWDPRDDQLTVSWRVFNSQTGRVTNGSYTLTAVLVTGCNYDQTIQCGPVYQGNTTNASNSITYYTGCLNDAFHGRDQVFRIVKPSHQGRLTVNLFNDRGLDLFLLDDCSSNGVSCIDYKTITSSTPYAGIHQQVGAGTYYIAVDAASSNVYGNYTLSATCGYLDCHQATQLYCEETVNGSTHQGDNDISAIRCDGTLQGGYTGKEKLYYFELTERKEVTINLNNIDHGKNLDLFLLNECDEYSTIACSRRSSNSSEAITKTLDAGTYYVLVDGNSGANAAFQLTVDWGCCEPYYNYECNDITYEYIGTNGELKYRFQVPSTSQYLGAVWTVRGGEYGSNDTEIGSGTSLEWTFPQARDYIICVKYPSQHSYGCYDYCCKLITVEEYNCEDYYDYNCNFLTYQFTGSTSALTYRFTNNSSNTAESWTVSGGGFSSPQTIGSGNNITYTFSAPGTYTVCFKYLQHDGCYYYCCKTITVAYPCEDYYDYNCNFLTYQFTGSTSALTYRFTNNSSNTAESWTVSGGGFSSPQTIGSGNNITYTFSAPGTYTVCFKYLQHDGCYYYCCKTITVAYPCEDYYDYNCNQITHNFIGTGGQLRYRFEVPNTSQFLGATWVIQGGQYGTTGIEIGTGFFVEWTFPTAGSYTICIKYPQQGGGYCYNYCCKTIHICEDDYDYHCNAIGYQFIGTSSALTYRLTSNAANGDGTWTVSSGGLNSVTVGSGNNITYTFPSAGQYTICYKYRKDDGCYYYCCKTICVEYPFDCRAIKRRFDYTAGQYVLSLDGISTEDILSWTNDNTGEVLGSGASIRIHNPYDCVVISVKYKDPVSNCYKICCIRLCRVCYGEHDMTCDAITWYYDQHVGQYRFSVPSNTDYNGGTWTIKGAAYARDVKNGGSGNMLSWTFPSSGKYTVCYTYATYDGAIFSCCKTIFVKEPSNCENIVTSYESSSGQYVLSLGNDKATQVEWRSSNSNQILGSGNEIRINNPSSCQYIYAIYFDVYAACYTYCRVEICPYEACFSFDPYFSSPWLAGLVAHFETLCSSDGSLRIETAYYRGQCVIVVPPITDPCGGAPTGGGYVLDAAGNLLFSYGGLNPEYNQALTIGLQNRTTFWSCGTNLSEDNTEMRSTPNMDSNTGTVLLNNQPNPFSRETLIRFQLPNEMEATISIVNAIGQVVFEQTNLFTEGENEIFFEADQNLTAGVYFLQLQGDNINRSSTMIIARR